MEEPIVGIDLPKPQSDLAIPTVSTITLPEFLGWRLEKLEQKVESIDKTGSHGVQELKMIVQELQKDFAQHEIEHKEVAIDQKSNRRFIITTIITLVIPLYPLILGTLAWVLIHQK